MIHFPEVKQEHLKASYRIAELSFIDVTLSSNRNIKSIAGEIEGVALIANLMFVEIKQLRLDVRSVSV